MKLLSLRVRSYTKKYRNWVLGKHRVDFLEDECLVKKFLLRDF